MSDLPPKLAGRVALVTGAARGLGRGIAHRLARLGADVCIADLDLAGASEFGEPLFADSVAAELRTFGVRSLEFQLDCAVRSDVDRMVATIRERLGSLDILVNNAGGMLRPIPGSSASQMNESDTRDILDMNLWTTIQCSQAAVPPMCERGWGRIVNVGSQAGLRGGGGPMANYGLAKAGVVHFTRTLAAEVGPWGITVNCIAPALIRTSRAVAQFPDRESAAERIPLRRLGVPEDAAKVVEFFCTELGDYVTGQVLGLCGGTLLFPF